MLRRFVYLAGCLAMIAALAPATGAAAAPGPALTTPSSTLQQALTCHGDLAGAERNPVLLVHGTFADSEINWNWNYVPALVARGETVCTVDLPDKSAGDIQVSTEYVVHAIRAMADSSGRDVAVIGFSQGGLEIRWALRWWPDLRHLVSDAIFLNTPNQGSAFPDATCTSPGVCAASFYQMRTGSDFLTALNKGRDAIGGVSYTALATADDPIFVLPDQARIDETGNRVENVVIQDICPDHHIDPMIAHVSLAFDGPAWALVVDALDHRGPADPSRIDTAVCQEATMPGVTLDQAIGVVQAYFGTLAELLGPNGPKAQGEPPLACYATRGCPGSK
jgi:triacylglycerol lipase